MQQLFLDIRLLLRLSLVVVEVFSEFVYVVGLVSFTSWRRRRSTPMACLIPVGQLGLRIAGRDYLTEASARARYGFASSLVTFQSL